MPETNLTENSPKEDYFAQTIYPEIISCFPREEMNQFLEGKNITYQEILSFFDKKEIKDEFNNQWVYNSDQNTWKERSLNEAFGETVRNAIGHIHIEGFHRLNFGKNTFPQCSEEEVKKIMEITESLGSFNQNQEFKNVKTRASSLFNS